SQGNAWVVDTFMVGAQNQDFFWRGGLSKFAPDGMPLSRLKQNRKLRVSKFGRGIHRDHPLGSGFAWISRAKPSFTSLAPALLTTAPFIVSGAAKQRSSRCAAALIISSCASVSLTLMIQPFLSIPEARSIRAPHRNEPPIGGGRRGLDHPRVMRAASDDDTMLDAERKASPFCSERAIVVNEPEESACPDVMTFFHPGRRYAIRRAKRFA